MDTIAERYTTLTDEELHSCIAAAKATLGSRLVVLGHHYQSDDVIQYADFRGDSLKLSQVAAEQKEAEFIVFCGVHFMAESADILSRDDQIVSLPNLRAGCGMADLADEDDVAAALEDIQALTGDSIVPIAYVNSTAGIKALTGRSGGACCTSSNVRNVFAWALRPKTQGGGSEVEAADGADAPRAKIFAVPDEHLARNTAIALGYSLDDCVVYDPDLPNGGLTPQQARDATFILWRGWCYVHQIFQVEHVHAAREDFPEAKIIVHPECCYEVLREADGYGSTSQIIQAVEASEPGSQWVIGTESNMVFRLAQAHPDKTIRLLSRHHASCIQMARIDLPHLAWCLESLVAGTPINVVTVEDNVANDAKIALQRMLEIRPVTRVSETN